MLTLDTVRTAFFGRVCALLTCFGFCDGSCFWGNSLGIIAFLEMSSVFMSLHAWCIPNKWPVGDTLYSVEIFDGGHCTKQPKIGLCLKRSRMECRINRPNSQGIHSCHAVSQRTCSIFFPPQVLDYYNEACLYSSDKGLGHTLARRAAYLLQTDQVDLALR